MAGLRMEYDPPIRADVHCTHCGDEIEAVARFRHSLEFRGLHAYEWRHVTTGNKTCTHRYDARPYDGWRATKQIEAAIEAQRAADDALAAAMEDEEDDTP